MFLILLNCHATLCYCVQSHSKLSVTIYQNRIVVFAVALTDTQAKIPLKHCFHQHTSLLELCQSFIQFYKLYMCSMPVAIEHWLCDALHVSPAIAYLVSMAKSRCVNLNLIHPKFCINCQWRDNIHSEQFCHTVKAAL